MKDSDELVVEEKQEIPLLKEKLPQIHDLVDFNSFQKYAYATSEGESAEMEGYAVKQNDEVIGFYMTDKNGAFYTALTDDYVIHTDLITDKQVIAERKFDPVLGRNVADISSLSIPIESLDVQTTGSRGPCEDLCDLAFLACVATCGAIEITIRLIDGPIIVGVYDAIAVGVAQACLDGCLAAGLACRALC